MGSAARQVRDAMVDAVSAMGALGRVEVHVVVVGCAVMDVAYGALSYVR